MNALEFDTAQRLLGLNNTSLAEALGTDDGSISRWKKGKAPIPSYIEVSIRLLESRMLTETIIPLSLHEITTLYRKIEISGKSISQYLADLMRADINATPKTTYTPAEIASSRLNEEPPQKSKSKQPA